MTDFSEGPSSASLKRSLFHTGCPESASEHDQLMNNAANVAQTSAPLVSHRNGDVVRLSDKGGCCGRALCCSVGSLELPPGGPLRVLIGMARRGAASPHPAGYFIDQRSQFLEQNFSVRSA